MNVIALTNHFLIRFKASRPQRNCYILCLTYSQKDSREPKKHRILFWGILWDIMKMIGRHQRCHSPQELHACFLFLWLWVLLLLWDNSLSAAQAGVEILSSRDLPTLASCLVGTMTGAQPYVQVLTAFEIEVIMFVLHEPLINTFMIRP